MTDAPIPYHIVVSYAIERMMRESEGKVGYDIRYPSPGVMVLKPFTMDEGQKRYEKDVVVMGDAILADDPAAAETLAQRVKRHQESFD